MKKLIFGLKIWFIYVKLCPFEIDQINKIINHVSDKYTIDKIDLYKRINFVQYKGKYYMHYKNYVKFLSEAIWSSNEEIELDGVAIFKTIYG